MTSLIKNGLDTIESLSLRRKRVMPSCYTLFYDKPVHLVRGENVWLFGQDGKSYLDFYNNVRVVGYCNPVVTSAIFNQLTKLNTHTRYLTDNVVLLAEKIVKLMPDEIEKIIFTCTGSEANDLAYRVAKAHTGNSGFIVTRNAYHGGTEALYGLSPSLCGQSNIGENVFLVDGIGREDDTFFENISRIIEEMTERGIKPAGIYLDTVFSSDGIFTKRSDSLIRACALVKKHGGLVIADEVQAGFFRMGDVVWGFQKQGLEPDLVTLGKPMGNGYPIAGLAGRSDVLENFSSNSLYFNTFGAGNVAVSAALAVLDIIESDKLQENALIVGNYIKEEISKMMHRRKLISAVRGCGLFLGVELSDLENDQHVTSRIAHEINEELKNRGVLVGLTGPNSNVIKIRPPLTVSIKEAEYFIEQLDAVLKNTEEHFS